MSLDYINEAFRCLDLLTEDVFRADSEGISELSDFMSSDVDNEETISIIDMDAETEDDLLDSYVGKLIVECNVCHSPLFRNKEDIKFNENDGSVILLCNDEECACPKCGEDNGFVIKGEIHEFSPEQPAPEEEPAEITSTEVTTEPEVPTEPALPIEESLTEEVTLWDELVKSYPELAETNESVESCDLEEDGTVIEEDQLTEAFKNVSLETEDQIMTMTSEENGKVTVTTEPVANEGALNDEMITPVSPETEDALIDAQADIIDEQPAEEVVETPSEEELDFDFDEVVEESINHLTESYLKRVYENVDSFKLTSCSTTPKQLILEGLISFKSGATKNTGFIFEAKDATRDGKLRFIGENAHLSRGRKAFTLVGSLNENKLMCESFTYNYRAKTADGKSTRVYGKVNNK